jgi:TonB family protein
MIAPLLCVFVAAQLPLLPSAPLIMVDGAGRAPRMSADGTITRKKSSGALRSEELFTDFTLTFDVAMDKDTEVVVMIRANDLQGSELRGPTVHLPAAQTPGAWRQVEIVADGKQLTFKIDGTLLAKAENGAFPGLICFVVRKGKAGFRRVTIAPIDRPFEPATGPLAEKELKARGGTSPRLLEQVKPSYSENAMRAKVQGIVTMEAVVMLDGSIGAVKVVRSLHPELDATAVGTVRHWKFAPAMVDGKAVASLVVIEMQFMLR